MDYISIDNFERYFGSVLLNVRKSPVNTDLEDTAIILAIIVLISLGIYNICVFIIKNKMKKYLKQRR